MSAPTFTCRSCGETFPESWADADAFRESVSLFGWTPPENLVTVCDDCWSGVVRGSHLRVS